MQSPRAFVRRAAPSLAVVCLLAAVIASAGCAGEQRVDPDRVAERLRPLGLELETEAAAGVPPAERGRYVPCRVRADRRDGLLPPDPAGYLIVGVLDGEELELRAGRRAIVRALERWAEAGSPTRLSVRRNPFRSDPSEAWDVEIDLPPPLAR